MNTIDIYFVRHGETGGNIAKRHQQEDTHLSPLGRQQAKLAAEQVAKINPTHFFVSQRVRAVETGQAIANATDMVPESDPLFVELKRPDKMYGHYHHSVKTFNYLLLWWIGKLGDADHDGKAGESYKAFLQRLLEAKAKLESLPAGSRVVVVSHTVFINMFIAHMNNPKPLSLIAALLTFFKVKSLKNGSITHLECNKDTKVWIQVEK